MKCLYVKWEAMVLGAVLAGSALCQQSWASEGEIFGGPVGGTDIKAAYLPPTGWYAALITGYASVSRYYGDNGRVDPNTKISATANVNAAALEYVYPFQVFGGSVASSAVVPYIGGGSITLDGINQQFAGMGDLYSDLIVWSKYLGPIGIDTANNKASPAAPYGLTVKLAYSMIFPTGVYSPTQFVDPGHNTIIYIPNFAVSYLTAPNFLGDGLEISAHAFFDISGKNDATNYSTGTVWDVDYAVSEKIGRWQVGLAGYYAQQWESDIQNGQMVIPNGKKLETAALGPVVAYAIPELKAGVKLKVQFPVIERNAINSTNVWLSWSQALQ